MFRLIREVSAKPPETVTETTDIPSLVKAVEAELRSPLADQTSLVIEPIGPDHDREPLDE